VTFPRVAAAATLFAVTVLLALTAWLLFGPVLRVIEHGPRGESAVALTFDADMTERMEAALRAGAVEGWLDRRILSTLEEGRVPATFFITGLWARTYPEVVRRLSENPLFEIGNHSFDHAAFSHPCYRLPPAADKSEEVTRTQEVLRRLTGKTPGFFRFPGGCFSRRDLARVYFQGLRVVGWDVNSRDAFSADHEAIVTHVLGTTRKGSIIVMHLSGPPNAPATGRALPLIIEGLRGRGFSFVLVSRLLARAR